MKSLEVSIAACFVVTVTLVTSASMYDLSMLCSDLPENVLAEILGPAYNSRYMSIQKPSDEEHHPESGGMKREVDHTPAFYVDDTYEQVLDDKPAWVASNHYILDNPHLEQEKVRRKRGAKNLRQWECESKISWIDLGPEYFPRYLRSVECVTKLCWYGHFKCKPRSFTVKLLRRRRDMCTMAKPGTKIGVAGLPESLKVLWVWEERAVNFCCDCSQ